IGMPIDHFHARPEKQKGLLEAKKPHQSEIDVGGLKFQLNLITLRDNKGEHIGSAVEWVDQNSREAFRQEMGKIIDGAVNGELSVRGELAKVDGFYAPILEGVNRILSEVVEPVQEVQSLLAAMAKVPRERFVMESIADRAYEDAAMALPHRQTISQPYICAA
ncbi:MAG: hypothetical protein AAB214_12805, partial [Fibrobacterota bacterium]